MPLSGEIYLVHLSQMFPQVSETHLRYMYVYKLSEGDLTIASDWYCLGHPWEVFLGVAYPLLSRT